MTTCHSLDEKRDTMKSTTLTAMNENNTHSQTSRERGSKKLNTCGICLTGLLIIMLMPNEANGFVKSTTRSLSAVMVNGAIAMSASYKKKKKMEKRVNRIYSSTRANLFIYLHI